MNPVYEKLQKCYESYKAKINFTPKVALVLGSGLGDYADDIRVADTLDYHDIEGFPVSTVPGHKTFYLRICRRSSGGVHAGKSSLL